MHYYIALSRNEIFHFGNYRQASKFKTQFACEVKDYNVADYFERKEGRKIDPYTQFALIASKEAVLDSFLDFQNEDCDRIGVYYGSGIGGLQTIADEEDKARSRGYDRLSPFFIPSAIINLAAGNIAIEYGITGVATSVVTACASATNNLGEAFRAIRDGYLEVAISGGTEASLIPLGLGGFNVMQALNKSNLDFLVKSYY